MSAIKKDVRIGDCRLILGDCLEVMPALGKVDAVVTDPPYGVNFGYASFLDTPQNIKSICVPAVRMAVGMARSAIVTPGNANAFKYDEPRSLGAIYYPSGANCGPWGFTCSQPLFYYGKDPYHSKGLGSLPNSFATTEQTDRAIQHPCPKPLKTVKWMVARVSLAGETILDPFMGSGTTLVACAKMGRKGIGIELDPDYFEIACRRVEEAYRQPDMFIPKPAAPIQEGFL